MKKILAFVFAAALLVSCGTGYRMTQAERDALAADVAWSVDNQDMIIDITQIYPFRGPMIMTSREYSIVIHDGKIRTRLPFFGESRTSVIYGVDDSSIVLEDAPLEDLVIDVGHGLIVHDLASKDKRQASLAHKLTDLGIVGREKKPGYNP